MAALLDTDVESRFRAEVKRSTRTTAVIGGCLTLVVFPGWIGFDYLVVPDEAATFALIRLLGLIPIAACVVALFTDLGGRRPELLIMMILATVQGVVAFMIPQVGNQYAAYALGMSLPIYGSAFLLIWPPRYTATLIAISWGAVALALVTSTQSLDSAAIATVSFYLITASVLSFFGQAHRESVARGEFDARVALEHEQKRSLELIQELDRQTREDPLTALANRRAWDESLARECARARRGHIEMAILICDVDRLKEINDRLGHAAGDAVLRAVADLLRTRTRESDFVARIGGDEFGIISAGSGLAGATALGEALRNLIDQENGDDIVLARVTVSIGVAEWDGANDSPDRIVLRADQRLYHAKSQRNVVCSHDEPRAVR